MLYLASQSPRRRDLLQQIGVKFELLPLAVDESALAGDRGEDYVLRIAQLKATTGVKALASPDAVVLAADTIGLLGERLLLKPKDKADSLAMLRSMSGRSHTILTAVCVQQGEKQLGTVVKTQVRFRPLSEEEIEHYWHTLEPQDKAGSYAIQGYGAVFVNAIQGSYSNVVGLPLSETAELLSEFNVPIWQSGVVGE